jgi:hypothetical protein
MTETGAAMHTITLEKGLATFLNALAGKNRSQATIRAYQTDISHIWTHPGLQGQFRVTARRITTARIYTACHMEDIYALPALMDSALFLLNSLTTSDGLCEKQGLEEPV